MATTDVLVTLDGRICIWQHRQMLELLTPDETRAVIAAMTEAAAIQSTIWPEAQPEAQP